MDNEQKREQLINLRQRLQLFSAGTNPLDMMPEDKKEYEDLTSRIKLLEEELSDG